MRFQNVNRLIERWTERCKLDRHASRIAIGLPIRSGRFPEILVRQGPARAVERSLELVEICDVELALGLRGFGLRLRLRRIRLAPLPERRRGRNHRCDRESREAGEHHSARSFAALPLGVDRLHLPLDVRRHFWLEGIAACLQDRPGRREERIGRRQRRFLAHPGREPVAEHEELAVLADPRCHAWPDAEDRFVGDRHFRGAILAGRGGGEAIGDKLVDKETRGAAG